MEDTTAILQELRAIRLTIEENNDRLRQLIASGAQVGPYTPAATPAMDLKNCFD